MQQYVSGGESPTIPLTGRHILVLLSCGHLEEQVYWGKYLADNKHSDPIVCPYDDKHYFPYAVREIEVASTGKMESLKKWHDQWWKTLMINPKQLVLLNCGHYLQDNCWQIHRTRPTTNSNSIFSRHPLSCPFDTEHKFPVVIAGLSLKSDDVLPWSKLVDYRATRLSDSQSWMQSAFDPAKVLRSYQISYSQVEIDDNYRDFFGTVYYGGLLSLTPANLDQVLQYTIHNSEAEILAKVLPYIKNPVIPFDKNMTVLHLAAIIGNVKVVRVLLEGVSENMRMLLVNETTNMKLNALHYAVRQLNYPVAKLLLEYGCEVNQMDGYAGRTPLAYAIELGSLALAGLLVTSGRVDLSLKWTIMGALPHILVSLSYSDMVSHYLGGTGDRGHENDGDREFREAFEAVVSVDKTFHLVDRGDASKILSIREIIARSDLCEVSFLTDEVIGDLLDSGEDREKMCDKLALDSIGVEEKLVEVFNRHEMFCLLCGRPFTTVDEMITIYDLDDNLLECGLVHRVCPDGLDPGYVKCDKCQNWLIDGLSSKTISRKMQQSEVNSHNLDIDADVDNN